MASEIRVTNIKANDGTSSLTVANSTGNVAVGGTLTSTGAITASGGIANAGTISAGTFNGTLGTSASGGNSTEFVRNVDVVAMTAPVNTINTSSETTVHTFTYTPKVSGTSKIYADLFLHGFTGANRQDSRIIVTVDITGSGITDKAYNSGDASVFGVYDYGASGLQARFAGVLLMPHVVSTNTDGVSYALKVKMGAAATSYEIYFQANAAQDQTHIRFMEVA